MTDNNKFMEGLNDAIFVGADNFVRHKPENEPEVKILRFHHLEFYTADALNTMKRFSMGLGMKLVAKSDQETGMYDIIFLSMSFWKFINYCYSF